MLIGLDQFYLKYKNELRGKRVGLITNNSSRNKKLVTSLEIVKKIKDIKSLTLLTPEHGYFGDFQSGETINSYFDKGLGVRVVSLYRTPNLNETLGDSKILDMDETMRITDSMKDESKYPSKELLEQFDVIIFDLQDVGCRIYTYIATMVYTMDRLHNKDTEFILLDRPNPITGINMEGPILKQDLNSFIGALPLPIKHSMTIGEMAVYFNKFEKRGDVNLNVITLKNWNRDMWYDKTGYHWILPSPNMPTLETATVYPGMVLLEGTNLSEGRGTTKPFQIIGSPWIDAEKLSARMNNLKIPGVILTEVKFKPTFSKYSGKLCNGVLINITDRNKFRPFSFALNLLSEVLDIYPNYFEFHQSYFDRVTGDENIRKKLMTGSMVNEIIGSYEDELNSFKEQLNQISLY
jgi:uncharacterized protein YbbC (DUF1343 family)